MSPEDTPDRISTHIAVTPARNEADNLRRLGASLATQTWQPTQWIVVDNGSTDDTKEVVSELARDHAWVRLLDIGSATRSIRGESSVRAFNAGVATVTVDAGLISNIDADVSFDSDYFRRLRREFEENGRLGIAAGLCYEPGLKDWRPVNVTRPNIRGAALTFRAECLAELSPLEGRMAWDGISAVRARIRGWEAETIPALKYFHHRPTGARDRSRFWAWAEDGDSSYYMWYRPTYLLMRTLYRVVGSRDPAAAGLLWGYGRSALRREPRHAEPGFREFVHSQQSLGKLGSRTREVLGRDRNVSHSRPEG